VATAFQVKEHLELAVPGGRLLLELDEPAIRLALSIFPNDSGAPIRQEEVLKALEEFGIVRGIEPELIETTLEELERDSQPVERLIVARGRQPVPPEDAYLEIPVLDRLPRRDDDPENIIALCQKRIVNVEAGETVAIYHPITEGVPGVTVRDKVLPAEMGSDLTQKMARNLEWDDKAMVSKVDGRLVLEERSIYVDDVLRIEDDLTVVSGEIDFVGKIFVEGNIESGVQVRCKKDINVEGSIIGSDIHCEGDLAVKRGIIGSEETVVEVRGDLTTAFVENATLKVHGRCLIEDSFATSYLRCSRDLNMTQGRGHFVSGVVTAREGIRVREAGIDVNSKVRLSVGRDALAEERKQELDDEIERVARALAEIKDVLKKAGPDTPTFRRLPESKRVEIETLDEQRPRIEGQLGELKLQLEDLQPRLVPTHDASVSVLDTVHTDVLIEFPLVRHKVRTDVKGICYRFDSENVRIESRAAA